MRYLLTAAVLAALSAPAVAQPAPEPAAPSKDSDDKPGVIETVGGVVGGVLGSTAGAVGGPLGSAAAGFVGRRVGEGAVSVVKKVVGGDDDKDDKDLEDLPPRRLIADPEMPKPVPVESVALDAAAVETDPVKLSVPPPAAQSIQIAPPVAASSASPSSEISLASPAG